MGSINVIIDMYNQYYLESYKNIENIKKIENFLIEYSKIQKQDLVKPIFTQTKKYANYSNKKSENQWKKYEASNELEKIEEIIKYNMNKISKNTFEIISKNLISDIKKFENSLILEIISKEIYNKTINDIKFQNIYLDVIKNIWNDKSFYNNLVIIKKELNKFYWTPKNNNENNKSRGPFNNIKELDDDIHNELSLKNIFINMLQNEFIEKDKYISELENQSLEDEDKYKLTRKIYGFYEIIIKLYYSGEISVFFINYILYKLIINYVNNNKSYYIECINILLKLFVTDRKFPDFKSEKTIKREYIQKYIELINNIDYKKYNVREKFMLLDIKDYLNKILVIFNTPIKKIEYTNDDDNDIKKNLLKNNYGKITFILKNNLDNLKDNLLILFDSLFEYQTKKDIVLNILNYLLEKKIITKDFLINIFEDIELNLDDIELDIVNIKDFYNEFKKNII
jgi:hypothetical protein